MDYDDSELRIGSGAKRLRHGVYRTVYMDNRGKGRKFWRAEIQRLDTTGIVRLRKWFKEYKDARNWVDGK